jgi:uncharacterized protein YjbI with pentapeptide repeats
MPPLVIANFSRSKPIYCDFSRAELMKVDFTNAVAWHVDFRRPGLFVQLSDFLCKWPGLKRIWAFLCKALGCPISVLFGISCVYLL